MSTSWVSTISTCKIEATACGLTFYLLCQFLTWQSSMFTKVGFNAEMGNSQCLLMMLSCPEYQLKNLIQEQQQINFLSLKILVIVALMQNDFFTSERDMLSIFYNQDLAVIGFLWKLVVAWSSENKSEIMFKLGM